MSKSYGTWHSPMEFPHLSDAIFLDIETNIEMTSVWLIGIKLGEIEQQFLAWNFREEIDILDDFYYFLTKHPHKPLVCYSTTNFDFRILMHAARKYKLNYLEVELSNRALIDMGTLLRRHFTPYGNRYSLKLLRFLISYDYDDISISGEDVAIEYYRQIKRNGRISEEFAKKASLYNLDDIRILHYMIELFQDNIKFTDAYSKPVEISFIRNILKNDVYSKNINEKYLRISVLNDKASRIQQHLMCCGLPLPQISQGVNITAMYWKSTFSFQQAKNLLSELELL